MDENLNVKEMEGGAKTKRFYQRKIFWILIIILLGLIYFVWWMSQPIKVDTNYNDKKSSVSGNKSSEYIPEDKIDDIYVSTKAYKGMNIKITGKVFNVNKDSDGIEFQIHRDVDNQEQNTIIYFQNTKKTIKEGDFVAIDGYVYDTYSYTNLYGGTISAPYIVAYNVKIKSYKDVVRPTIKEVSLNKSINKHGVNVTVEKVEFAEKETRVYVTIENNSGYEFNLYEHSSKIVQNGSQYEYESNYKADYKEIQSEVLSGVSTSGVLTFPAMSQSDFRLILSCRSDNYSWKLRDFTFDIAVEK